MKRWIRPTRFQWYSFLASMPLIAVLANYIIFKERTFRDINIWLISFPIIYLGGLGIWRVQVLIL